MEKQNLKEIKQHGTESFKVGYYYLESNDNKIYVKHHWHNETELIYLKRGKFNVEINMEKYHIEDECFIFVNSEELHFIELNEPFCESAIVFDLKMLSFDMFDSVQREVIQPLLAGKLKFPRIIEKNSACFEQITNEYDVIYNSYKGNGELTQRIEGNFTESIYSQIKIKTSLLNIIGILYDSNMLLNEENYKSDYRVEYIKTVILYIEKNYSEKLKINDLAKAVNMNEQYFCRFFKSMLGKSPMEYVNEYRLKKTKEMLITSNKKITDICLECGFNNMGNFINYFKKMTGSTPLKYRKQSLKKS